MHTRGALEDGVSDATLDAVATSGICGVCKVALCPRRVTLRCVCRWVGAWLLMAITSRGIVLLSNSHTFALFFIHTTQRETDRGLCSTYSLSWPSLASNDAGDHRRHAHGPALLPPHRPRIIRPTRAGRCDPFSAEPAGNPAPIRRRFPTLGYRNNHVER